MINDFGCEIGSVLMFWSLREWHTGYPYLDDGYPCCCGVRVEGRGMLGRLARSIGLLLGHARKVDERNIHA